MIRTDFWCASSAPSLFVTVRAALIVYDVRMGAPELMDGSTLDDGPLLVLIAPPQKGLLDGFPSGLIALANWVRLEVPGVPVELLDLSSTSPGDVGPCVKNAVAHAGNRPILAGVTATTASYQSALHVVRVVKRVAPDAVTMLGGHHGAAQDNLVLRAHPDIDIVFRGEAELALVQLLRDFPDYGAVAGITFRGSDGAILRNPAAPRLEQHDLDRIAPLDRGRSAPSVPGKFDHTTYVSARGCPLACSFCSVANQTIRAKSPKAIAADLCFLSGVLGFRRIAIEDNFFAHSPKRTRQICAAISAARRETPFTWDCQTRVESMRDPATVRLMADSGCEAVYLGAEALAGADLRYLGKTNNPAVYLRVLEHVVVPNLLESSISTYLNLQLGLPRQRKEDRDQTMEVLGRLGAAASDAGREIVLFPQLHVIYPGTKHFLDGVFEGTFGAFDDASAGGLEIDRNLVFEEFTLWESQEEPILRWLGEHFAHGVGGIPIGILDRDSLERGRFVVRAGRVAEIATQLTEIDRIPGIEVFKYGTYLTRSGASRQAPGLTAGADTWMP